MATPEDAFASLSARLVDVEVPSWETAEDVARLSQIASARAHAAQVGDVAPAQGLIHLAGGGVREHSASLASTGAMMSLTQRLVTSIGAALEGTTALVGRLSASVVARTELNLAASPLPGSLELTLVPSNAQAVLNEDGQATLDEPDVGVLDRSLLTLLHLLRTAEESSGTGDDLAAEIQDLGPRVASSIKTWTKLLADAHFDAEIAWEGAGATRDSARISRGTSAFVNQVVTGRRLDAQRVTITGTVRTVSDVANWAVDQDNPIGSEDRIRISASQLSPVDVTAVHVGARVQIDALMQETVRPGMESRLSYTALQVSLLPGDAKTARDDEAEVDGED